MENLETDWMEAPPPSQDKLDRIREMAREAVATQLDIEALQNSLAKEQSRLNTLLYEDLPMLLSAAGMSRVDLEPLGNLPARSIELKVDAGASIPLSWPEDKRRAAFDELSRLGLDDAVAVKVTFTFPKGRKQQALSFAQQHATLHPEVRESIHHGTLSKWLREQIRDGVPLPDLETIGGYKRQVAMIKEKD